MWGGLSGEKAGVQFAIAAILGSEFCGTHDHILLSHVRDFPNLRNQFPVFISLKNIVVPLHAQSTGFTFRRFKRSARLRWLYIKPTRLHSRNYNSLKLRLKLIYDRQ
jgi:hypothetical protein